MKAFRNGQPITLDPSKAKGKGGEADIFDIGNGEVAKIFKTAKHPDFAGEPAQAAEATKRLQVHQTKLLAFPRIAMHMPSTVVTPKTADLLTDAKGFVVGYAMPFIDNAEVLLSYTQQSFRQAVPAEDLIAIFRQLRQTVDVVHSAGVVLGDFNDLNILVKKTTPYVIDADSFQFQGFLCKTFTTKFVDPLLCDPNRTSPELIQPHNINSDWYAYMVMLMQSLLFVGPYGGVFKPKPGRDRFKHDQRPLKRVTVWDPDVQYPKPALPYKILPDDLLHAFVQTFVHDLRGVVPEKLLSNLRGTTCTACSKEHYRAQCPYCFQTAPAAVKTTTMVRGKVTATREFKTSGTILHAAYQKGKLRYLYHEGGAFQREHGNFRVPGKLDTRTRYRVSGDRTLMAQGSTLVILNSLGGPDGKLGIDSLGKLPMFDATGDRVYWSTGGQLLTEDMVMKGCTVYIGDVLQGQTTFWVGEDMGFGFYRAGELSVAFVFDTAHRGINDTVKLPRVTGQIVDVTTCFGKEVAWFTVSAQENGKTVNRCFAINKKGEIIGQAEAEEGDGSWLGHVRGKCAMGSMLFSATDDGIVRLKVENGQIVPAQSFPDTEPFVDTTVSLFPGNGGVYVVTHNEVTLLKIA